MRTRSLLPSIVVGLLVAQAAQASDVDSYLIAKGQIFRQTNAAAPVQIFSEDPFEAYAAVTPTAPGDVLSATLRLPNGVVVGLTNYDSGSGTFDGSDAFTTKAQLDAAAGIGTYNFVIQTLNDGTNRPSLILGADNYPPTPRIANWQEAQEIESLADFTLQWLPFTNGTSSDFVVFSIEDLNEQPVFSTPGYLETNVLDGTSTSATVPGGMLEATTAYQGRLMFIKRTASNTNTILGALGLAGYYKQTIFPLATLPESTGAGRIQLGAQSFSVSEASPMALLVPIYRTSTSLSGEVSVTLTISDGTAHSGTDYQVNNLTSQITFPDGSGYAEVGVTPLNNVLLDGNRTLTFSLSNPTGGAVLGSRSNAVVTILDDEIAAAGRFQFSQITYTGTELSKQALLTVNRVGGTTGSASVSLSTANGTAIGGLDFTPTNGVLTFAPGQPSRQIVVPITDDSLDETNETFHVLLTLPTGGAALGSNTTATISITDNDTGGAIAFSGAAFGTNENSGFALITVNRSGGAASGVSVDFTTQDGVALAGSDYTATNGTLLFGSNELTKTFAVTITNDTLAEGNETLGLSLSNPGGGATLGTISNATLTVRDDESSVAFTNATYIVGEAGPSIAVNIVRSGALITPVGVSFSTVDGSAVSTNDYRGTNGTVTFPPNTGFRTITIPIANDTIVEPNETFSLFLHSPTGGVQLGTLTNTSVVITNNDFGGAITFSASNYPVAEAGRFVTVTLSRSGGSASGVSVDFTTADGTATDGLDYSNATRTVTFGATDLSKTIQVPILNDTLDETNETVLLSLTNPQGGVSLGVRSNAAVTITDDDTGGAIAFSSAAFSTNEFGTFALITVARSGGSASGVTVDFATENGTALDGSDYFATNGTLTFGSNQASRTFMVPLTNDLGFETNETVLLHLTNPTGGARLGALSNATLLILEDESTLAFTNATYTVSETGPTLSVNVVRTGARLTPVTVGFATTDGTAISTNDYRGTNGTLTFPVNTAFRTISIPIVNDTLVDSNETFTIALFNPQGGAQLGGLTNVTATITDNDGGGVLTFSATNYPVGESGKTATVTISRSGGSASGVSVDFTTSDGTATAGLDYTNSTRTVTFNANDLSKTIQVPIINDTLDETNETVLLSLTNPQGGASLGVHSNASVAITDDDTGGVIAFSSAAFTTNENSAFALITVTRSSGAASDVSVDFTTQDGVALAGSDYAATNGTLVFASNQTSKTFTVPLTDDILAEGNESLGLSLLNPTGGAALGAISNATLTIRDDESSVAFTNAAYTVTEAGPSISVNVIRSGALITQVSVAFSTLDGSAGSTNDYRGTNGTLVFPVNTAMKTITIPIANDTLVEGNETFDLFLHSPSNGLQLGTLTNTTLTITDNDQGGIINFRSGTFVTNENQNAVITLTRTNGAAGGVSVLLSTQDGSATAGSDYTAVSQTVVFGAGQTSTNVIVPVINDALDENGESLQLLLSNPQGGGALGTVSNASLTINDDDSGGVFRFNAPSYVTNENAGAFLVNIVRSGGVASNVTVSFFTQDGTATSAQPDYTATNGTLAFGAGETNKFITVPIVNDTAPEGNETLSVLLTNVTGGASISNNTAGLTIVDDESSVTFTNASYTIGESGGSLAINVVRSGALGTAVSVDFSTVTGTAASPGDYTATNGTLSFPANTALRTIVIPIVNDFTIENPESFSVRLANPQGGVQLGTVTNATVNITNDDLPGVIRFSSTSYTGSEGSVVNVSVQRTGGTGAGVSVQFNMVNVTATDADYNNVSQLLTFAGGETNKNIAVTLKSDAITEPTETVNLSLTGASAGATLGTPSTAVLNINNQVPAGCTVSPFTLTGPGFTATVSMGGAYTAFNVSGGLVGNNLSIFSTDAGLITRGITINLGSIPPGSTGTFFINDDPDFVGFSHSTLNPNTMCSLTKTYNSELPSTGCITITEWNTTTKTFKATFNCTLHGVDSGTSCGIPPVITPGPVPTETPSISNGQVWVVYH